MYHMKIPNIRVAILALLLSLQSLLFGQETLPSPTPSNSSGSAADTAPAPKRKKQQLQQAQSLAAPAEAESIYEPQVSKARSAFARAGRTVRAINNVPPVIVRFSDRQNSQEALEADLNGLTDLIRAALQEVGDEELLSAADDVKVRVPNNSSVRALYTEGFGAVVFVKVEFPVLGPNVAEQKPQTVEKPKLNQTQDKEVLLGQGGNFVLSPVAKPYDAGQVGSLKSNIVAKLKEASRFDSISTNEFLSVVIYGPPAAGAGENPSEMRGTVLTLRARKSDVDAIAKGQIDYARFNEKITSTAYRGSGYGVVSINSWVGGSTLQAQPGQIIQRRIPLESTTPPRAAVPANQ